MTDRDEPCWRKSSRSGSGGCVEVATDSGHVLIRDSKNPGGPVLEVSIDAFRGFVALAKEFGAGKQFGAAEELSAGRG